MSDRLTMMLASFPTALLQTRAPVDPADWRAVQDNWSFTGKHLMPAWSFFIVAAVLVLVITGLWLWRRYQAGQLRSSPVMIFHHIARRRGLSLADQWLLIRIARHQALPTPLTLLLSPQTLRRHAHLYLLDLGPTGRGKVHHRIEALVQSLFGEERQPVSLRRAA